jgi:hypothetical protein
VVIERILERDPEQAETLHCKAVICAMYGEYEEAKDLVLQAGSCGQQALNRR